MAEVKTAISADIEKFSGFRAKDGTTHATLQAATGHMKDVKVKEALALFAQSGAEENGKPGIGEMDNGYPYISDLAEFLFANRDVIQACYKQEVRMRATRKARVVKPKVIVPSVPLTAALTAIASLPVVKDAPVVIDGVSFIDTDDEIEAN